MDRISFVRVFGKSFRRRVFDALGGRGTLASWANCSVGVPSCPAPPRRPAVRPDPTRGTFGFSIRQIPGHVLHEKGLQRQKGVGTRVSSQERRALFVPVINRLLNADFVPPSVLHTIFPGHALHEKGLQGQISAVTLVSSQERRALAVPLINRLSTGYQPRMNRWSTAGFIPPSVSRTCFA